MRYILSTFLIAALFIFEGCGHTKPSSTQHNKKRDLPHWYLHPPKDSKHYLYGIGSGIDRKSAVKTALIDMISKLSVSIESTMHIKEETYGEYFANSISQSDIKTHISSIQINNFEILKTALISYRQIAVLLRTDRYKLAKSIQMEIETQLSEFEHLYKRAKKADRISRYNTLKQIAAKAEKLLPYIYILSQLNASDSNSDFLQRVKKLQNGFQKEQSSLLFSLHTSNKEASKFAAYITAYLLKNGWHSDSSKDALTIRITTNDTTTHSPMGELCIIQVDIKVYDKGNLVGENTLIYKSYLNASKEDLYRRTAIKFSQELDTKGVQKVLGINLDL